MQRNFILTDIMKTGYHQDLENFISMNTMVNQTFDTVGQYYDLHLYDLDQYDRKFAILDYRVEMRAMSHNQEFMQELKRRCDLLHSQGFVFIKATPWESIATVNKADLYPKVDIEHCKWTGGVSWFWFYMYNKHKETNFNFDHSNKKYDFLYLNKEPRPLRKKLYNKLHSKGILENSLHTNWPERKLPAEYELPWAQDYPSTGMDQDIYEKPYNDTAFSIVSEAYGENDIFMTEKIWKPIIAQHMFIVHGNHLYLQKLRELGFRTFNSYFEEAYDLDKDPEIQIDTIVDVCDRLRDSPWKDMYLHSQALRKHNLDNFFDKDKLGLAINDTLNLFLEFADSRQIPS